MGSLSLRPSDSLTIPRMALSVGFIRFVSSTDATQATRHLTITLVGLTPTEHASLRWTHSFAKTGSVVNNILADSLCSISPQNEISLGNLSGSCLKGGEAQLPVEQNLPTEGDRWIVAEGWPNGLKCLSRPSGVALSGRLFLFRPSG